MSKPAFTPGPWRMSRMDRPPIGRQANGAPWPTDVNGNVFWGYSISGSSEGGAAILPTLAAVHNFPDQIHANAHLISAAPDMYKALLDAKKRLRSVSLYRSEDDDPSDPINKALAKAEGRS